MDGNDIDDVKRLLERRNNEINIIRKSRIQNKQIIGYGCDRQYHAGSMHEYFDFEHL